MQKYETFAPGVDFELRKINFRRTERKHKAVEKEGEQKDFAVY
jgi:hypothetical protein